MPELTLSRTRPTPAPMVCMYCGAPATSKTEWRVENRTPAPNGGGADVIPVPAGDDPVSAAVGLVLLPFVLWDALKGLAAASRAVAGRRPRPAPTRPPQPPRDPPTTLVAVTTCARHRRFRDRFVWAGAALALALAGLWAWAVVVARRVMGTDDTDLAVGLVLAAVLSSVLLPVALSIWYAFAGPVLVDRVTETTVVLDRVRPAYFDATGARRGDEGV